LHGTELTLPQALHGGGSSFLAMDKGGELTFAKKWYNEIALG
jgi:hypothetical protein